MRISAVETLPPAAIWEYLPFAENIPELLNVLPEEFIGTLAEKDQTFVRFGKTLPPRLALFLMQRRENIDEFVQNSLPTQRFLEDLAVEPNVLHHLQKFIQNQTLDYLPWPQRIFWSYLKDVSQDMFQFLIERKESFSSYITEQGVDEDAVRRDFVREIRARPENCRTYETLTMLFENLQVEHPRGDELGLVYLRIAEAHRIRPIGAERTEVESVERLRETFSALYHTNMTPFEKLSWKILQRHLPFTANERARGEMRQKALDVEQLNGEKLGWVHQSVHNYASLLEVDYLRAFKKFLETGEKRDLGGLRSRFTGSSQAPDYTEGDRQVLLAIPTLLPELDQLIYASSRFYEVRPENLVAAREAGIPRALFADPKFAELFDEVVNKDLPAIDEAGALRHFCLNVGRLRENILALGRQDVTLFDKTRALVLDTMFDDISQKAFTKYKDVFQEKRGTATPQDVFEAAAVLREAITASFQNGEIPEEAYRSKILAEFVNPEVVTSDLLHRARLMLPFIKHEIDSYWQRFTAAARPEMVEMLIRSGLSAQEAEQRVFYTDLVEFRKSSTAFVVEPLLNLVEKELARIAEGYSGPDLGPEEITARYQELTAGQKIEEPKDADETVRAYIQERLKNIPIEGKNLTQLGRSLTQFAQSEDAQAERFLRDLQPGYLNKETLKRETLVLNEGENVIKFYPYNLYGIDAVVITVNGAIVQNPLAFVKERYRGKIVPAMEHALREGD